MYGFTLYASKAFDSVNYCILFDILLKRNVCPLACRLLLNKYMYCVYIDGLLPECDSFVSRFKDEMSNMWDHSLLRYCSSFYGSPLFN